MNKKLISLSLAVSILSSSALGPVWAGGIVGEGSVRSEIPSALHLQDLPLDVPTLGSGISDPQIQGSQELVNFEEGAGLIQEGVGLGGAVKAVEKPLSPAVSINRESPKADGANSQATFSKKFTIARRLSMVVKSKLQNLRDKFFDGSRSSSRVAGLAVAAFAPAIRPLPKLKLPKGVETDSNPIVPDTRHLSKSAVKLVNSVAIPNEENVDDVVNTPLQADPANGADIEGALRGLIDQSAAYGVKSDEMGTSNVRLVEVPGQLPTWYVSFHQQKASHNVDGTTAMIPVFGSSLNFTIHVEDGKVVVQGVQGRLFPGIDVDADQKVSDDVMKARIRSRLKIENDLARQISFRERQIFYVPAGSKGEVAGWHAASLYKVDGIDALVAADIATGQTFLWDMRLGAAAPPAAPPATVSGANAEFDGLVPLSDHDMTDPPKLHQVPLPGVTVSLPDGKEVVADDNGRVSVDLPDDTPMEVTARLDGPHAVINNESGEPLEVKASLVKGKDGVVVVFNSPTNVTATPALGVWGKIFRTVKRWLSPSYRAQDDAATQARQNQERELAQVTAYYSHHTFITWAQAHGVGSKDGLLNKKLTINVNIADECNAYYDPSSDTLNFFLSSARCINTGTLPGVSFHETGHWTHALVAGYVSLGLKAMASVDPGLGEGVGDMFATHILQTSLIGEHFFSDPSQSPLPNGALRETTNKYQFNPNDEVHNQGLAFMGTVGYGGAWHSLLIKALGEDKALEVLQGLIFPHIYGYATATDIPAALGVIYLAAKSLTDATVRDAALTTLQQAAAQHAMTVPAAQKQNPQTPTPPSV